MTTIRIPVILHAGTPAHVELDPAAIIAASGILARVEALERRLSQIDAWLEAHAKSHDDGDSVMCAKVEAAQADHQTCRECGATYIAKSHEYPCPYCEKKRLEAQVEAVTRERDEAKRDCDNFTEAYHRTRAERDRLKADLAAMTARATDAEKCAAFRLTPILEETAKELGCGGDWSRLSEDARRLKADLAAAKERAEKAEAELDAIDHVIPDDDDMRSTLDCVAHTYARNATLERERDAARAGLAELRLEVWDQWALDMGDGWQSDGALSTLEDIADDLVECGALERHPERPWYRRPILAKHPEAGALVLLNTDETAALLRCSPKTLALDRVRRRWRVPFVKVGRCVRYDRAAVQAWLASRNPAEPVEG